MKKIKYMCSIPLMMLLFMAFNSSELGACPYECTYDGCNVRLNQGTIGWTVTVNCDDGFTGTETGVGLFLGTICGDEAPEPCVSP